jgi:lipopolysaccharide transport system permease protein
MRLDFLIELIRRRVVDRYIGTSSRLLWVFLSPVVPLLVNVAVFYFIANIPQIQSLGLSAYAAFMFSGLLPFRIIQRASVEACDLLVNNMELLRSAIFPLAFLSLSAVGALLVEFVIQAVFMAGLLINAGVALTWTILLLPVAVIALFALALGLSWVSSIVSYVLRDLQEIVAVLFSALLYVTPIMYPPEAAPSFLRVAMRLNPLSSYVVAFRDTILPGPGGLHVTDWAVALGTSIVVLGLGFIGIRGAQRFVGDMV